MWEAVLEKHKTNKYKLINGISFVIFLGMYFTLDYFNGGYQQMAKNFGVYLVIINILLNIIMSMISAFMISLSSALFFLSGKEGNGSFFGFISLFFGILTYGCTSCVIAFFAAIGITFSVAVLPFAGLPYKLISFVLVILGFIWLKHEIKHSKCDIKKR